MSEMRLIDEDYFNCFFPDGELGQICYREISKFVIEYSPEFNGNGNDSCWDSILLYVKDYAEPLPFQMISSFLNFFKDEWRRMEVSFGNIPVNGGYEPIKIEDILDNQKPVYFIGFYDLGQSQLKYFDYFFNKIQSVNCK